MVSSPTGGIRECACKGAASSAARGRRDAGMDPTPNIWRTLLLAETVELINRTTGRSLVELVRTDRMHTIDRALDEPPPIAGMSPPERVAAQAACMCQQLAQLDESDPEEPERPRIAEAVLDRTLKASVHWPARRSTRDGDRAEGLDPRCTGFVGPVGADGTAAASSRHVLKSESSTGRASSPPAVENPAASPRSSDEEGRTAFRRSTSAISPRFPGPAAPRASSGPASSRSSTSSSATTRCRIPSR